MRGKVAINGPFCVENVELLFQVKFLCGIIVVEV